MYLYHFGMQRLPFGLTPDTAYFCALPGHRAALNVLHVALASGEGFIKITGEVGTGKTLLCRKLLGELDAQHNGGTQPRMHCAYIPNPVLTPHELRVAIAHDLGMELDANESAALLARRLELKLLEIAQHDRPVVLIIDEAQALPDDSLETLRLLSNLETERHNYCRSFYSANPSSIAGSTAISSASCVSASPSTIGSPGWMARKSPSISSTDCALPATGAIRSFPRARCAAFAGPRAARRG